MGVEFGGRGMTESDQAEKVDAGMDGSRAGE